jgi:transposase
MGEREEIEAGEHEEMVERVAAIDVAKAQGVVCTRVPNPSKPKLRTTTVWEVGSTTNAICDLADQLMSEHIERVVVESTSDYWRPYVYLLEARGLTVWLVNAREVKQVPGRPKTDRLDAVWLAKLNERGHAAPLLRPPGRDPATARLHPAAHRPDSGAHQAQGAHGEAAREDALIKLSTVATDIFGVSGRAMMDALIAGERDPNALAAMARGRMRVKQAALIEALTGRFDEHHAELLRILLDQVDALSEKIEGLTARIAELIAQIPAAQAPGQGSGGSGGSADIDPGTAPLDAVARLDEIAGVGANATQTIIAEVGLNMNQFLTAGHLVSWAKLSPRTIQSGAKSRTASPGEPPRD